MLLGTVPADQLGIAVYGNDGELYCAGDAASASTAANRSSPPARPSKSRRFTRLELLSQRIGWSVF
jgi:hypothetical protein